MPRDCQDHYRLKRFKTDGDIARNRIIMQKVMILGLLAAVYAVAQQRETSVTHERDQHAEDAWKTVFPNLLA